jgi:uncharacterized protein (DUF1697 family)
MPRYVALLRAVNVGGRTVKMEALRKHFGALGFGNVETFIASGNVLFDSAARTRRPIETKIEDHLRARLGFEVATMVRSMPEMAVIAGHDPFPGVDIGAPDHALYVAFARTEPGADAKRKIESMRSDANDFCVRGAEVYWLRRERSMQTLAIGTKLEKAIGVPSTMRNITTVRKLAAL